MTERVLYLAMAIAPELVVERLSHLGAGRDRPGESSVGISDRQREHYRRGASTPNSGNSSAT
jgi:hypothetical protein